MHRKCYLKSDPLDLSTILQRIAEGDKQAIKECLDRYGNLVRSVAIRYISNRADAEDAVQEIFIDIWKNASKYDASKSPESAFITLIARRRIIDRLRKIKTSPQTVFSEIELLNLANNDYKKLRQLTDETPALVALGKLKPKQMQIIALAVFKGMTHSEIAKTVGSPLGTVKTNIRRGFNKIRNSVHLTNSETAVSFY